MGDSVPSAKLFEERLSALAHAAAGKAPEPPAQKEAVPLVPIFVGIDRDHEQLRETFLYRLGDKDWSVKPATSRFLLETSLPGGHTEKVVEDQFKAGLKRFTDWQPPRKQQLVKFQFYAPLGDQVFRDEVLWDIGNPMNGAETYAVRVCTDLGLGCDWFESIRAHVQLRLDEVKQDLREAPEDVELQPPITAVTIRQKQPSQQQQHAASQSGGSSSGSNSSSKQGAPRLEPFDPANDVESARKLARQQRLQQRLQLRQQQAAAAMAAAAATQQTQLPMQQQQQQQHQQVPLQPPLEAQQQAQQLVELQQLPVQQQQQQAQQTQQTPLPQQLQSPQQPPQQLQSPQVQQQQQLMQQQQQLMQQQLQQQQQQQQ